MNDFPLGSLEDEAYQDAMRDILHDSLNDDEEDSGMEYEIADDMIDRLEINFTYHSPNGDQGKRYEEIRESGRQLAFLICGLTPTSRGTECCVDET